MYDLVTSSLETYYYLSHSYSKEMSVDISLEHTDIFETLILKR